MRLRLLTTDLYEGAWLMSQGMILADLWMDGQGKRSIVFEFVGDRLEGLKDEYKRGRAEANVIQLKRALNELKDRMFWMLREKEETRSRKGGNYARATQETYQR